LWDRTDKEVNKIGERNTSTPIRPLKVHVVLSLYGGLVNELKIMRDAKKADKIERELCKSCGVPYDKKKREKYYDEGGENKVQHYVDVEIE